jgi:hypothetical protein
MRRVLSTILAGAILAIAAAGCSGGDGAQDRVQGETARTALASTLQSLGRSTASAGCLRLTRAAIADLEAEFSRPTCPGAFGALGAYLRGHPELQRALVRADIAPATDDPWSRPPIHGAAHRAWLRVRLTAALVDGTVSADVSLREEAGRWKLDDGVDLLLGR